MIYFLKYKLPLEVDFVIESYSTIGEIPTDNPFNIYYSIILESTGICISDMDNENKYFALIDMNNNTTNHHHIKLKKYLRNNIIKEIL